MKFNHYQLSLFLLAILFDISHLNASQTSLASDEIQSATR